MAKCFEKMILKNFPKIEGIFGILYGIGVAAKGNYRKLNWKKWNVGILRKLFSEF